MARTSQFIWGPAAEVLAVTPFLCVLVDIVPTPHLSRVTRLFTEHPCARHVGTGKEVLNKIEFAAFAVRKFQ